MSRLGRPVSKGRSPAASEIGSWPRGVTWLFALIVAGLMAGSSVASERYALIVSGASGGSPYAESYETWRSALVAALRGRFAFSHSLVIELAEQPVGGIDRASGDQVRGAIATIRSKMTRNDLLLVVLIGHGTVDESTAKFNLVGPDLDASQWDEMLRGMPGRLVVVNTTSASFPFLETLSGRGRVVMTATDSTAQRYETIFPEFFVKALGDPAGDLDKNGRLSVWEAFAYASAGVRQWYEQRGQLATERPVLDDNGDRIGKEAGAPGPDGALARATYLDPDTRPGEGDDPALEALHRRRSALEAEVEALKARKGSVPQEEYEAALEKLLVELARVSRQIRSRS